jgi:hypothetical protein
MPFKTHVRTGLVCAALVFTLAGCANAEDAPKPSSTPTPVASETATPTPSATAASDGLQAEAKVLFETLPEADWAYNYSDDGSSAVRENTLDVAGLKTWVSTLTADGWEFTPSDDSPESLVGYLLKDDRVVTVIASTNPDTGVSTTAVFYYSDSAWTGTSNQS